MQQQTDVSTISISNLRETFSRVADLKEQVKKCRRETSEDSQKDQQLIKDKIENKLAEVGYHTKLHGGTYRTVYTNGEYVVKFGTTKLGVKENSAEIRNNTRINKVRVSALDQKGTKHGSEYIADIPESGYETGDHRWLIMEEVEVTPNNIKIETASQLKENFARAGIHIEEIKPYNMGVQDGLPVIFDYAGT